MAGQNAPNDDTKGLTKRPFSIWTSAKKLVLKLPMVPGICISTRSEGQNKQLSRAQVQQSLILQFRVFARYSVFATQLLKS